MLTRLFAAACVAGLAAAQQNGPFYVDQAKGPSSGLAKVPGAHDDRYLIFPTFTAGTAEIFPGQIFDVYVEVHGTRPTAFPKVEVKFEGATAWVPVSALTPASGVAVRNATNSWTVTYTDPDFSKFNTTIPNALATATVPANGYWYYRIAINNVGTHDVRMTCDADVRMGKWTVVKPAKRQAKNVILFIGDGLNIPIVTASRLVSRGMTGGFPNSKLNMERSERVGTMSTSGIDSIMTDSANSAYTYASGHKSMMNALGVYADSNTNDMDDPKVELITERIRREYPGMAIGVVTTAEIQDATPAAWWAHTRRRSNKAEITYQMLYGQDSYGPVVPDVVFGGGGRYFNGSDLTNTRISGLAGRNLWAEAEAAGYDIVFDRASMKARSTTGSKVLGIWHYGNEDTWLDRHVFTSNLVAANHPVKYATTPEKTAYQRPVTDQPDLAEQVEAAIRILEARGGDNGFFLMVEGASIDKAEHPMDFDRAIGELIDMDNGIGVAMSFAAKHKDTLVLTTADHAQGYEVWGTVDTLAFNACNKADGTDFAVGAEYNAAEVCKNNAIGTYHLAGFPDYVDANKDNFPDSWSPRFTLAQGKADHPYLYRESFQVRPKIRAPDMSGIASAAAGSSSLSDDKLGIRLQGVNDPLQTGGDSSHTLADVPLWAHGPGSSAVRVHQQNVHVHTVMAAALGLGYDTAIFPSGSAPAAAAAADATCGGVLPSIVRHATLGLLTTVCAPGAATCDASRPIVIGTTTYYRMTVSMDDLHVRVAADECAAM